MKFIVRAEVAKDRESIARVNHLALEQDNENVLITKLRQSNEFIPELSLVAEVDDEVVGHILFYPVQVSDGITKHNSLPTAPISVMSKFQNKGIAEIEKNNISGRLDFSPANLNAA